MKKTIKVMSASRSEFLSVVIRSMIAHQPEMIMVGDVIDPIKLLHAARRTSVDMVIVTPLETNGMPNICRRLLAKHPRMKIVTLSSKGEAAYLYHSGAGKQRSEELSGQLIFGTIGEAVLPLVS
jgi:DNA-binding NarL/FixJ family response regulator